MSTLTSFQFIVILYIFFRAGDTTISAIIARDILRIICYGIVALLALVFIILLFVR